MASRPDSGGHGTNYRRCKFEYARIPRPIDLRPHAQEKEATASPPTTPEKAESPELTVPEKPASVSPHFPSFDYEAPVEWHPAPVDAVVEMGLQFSDDYGLSRPTEEFDFSSLFGCVDNERSEFDSEFAQWVNI